MKCSCLINGKPTVIFASSYRYRDDRIEFTESEQAGKFLTWFTLERVPSNAGVEGLPTPRTRLALDYYVRQDIASGLWFRLFRKAPIEKQFLTSLDNLVPFAAELKIPK